MLVQFSKAIGNFFVRTAPALVAHFTAKDYSATI